MNPGSVKNFRGLYQYRREWELIYNFHNHIIG